MIELSIAKRKTGRTIQIALLVAALFAANAFIGFLLSQESERAVEDQIRGRMMDLVSSAAGLLDGDAIETITAPDFENPGYAQSMTILEAFQDNASVAFVYCMRKVGDGEYAYIIDPSDDPAEYGELAVHSNDIERAAAGVPSVNLDAYEDRWGRFYSAYCPVFDSQGEVAGIVGVDFEASWFEDRVVAIDHMIITGAVSSLLLALITLIVAMRMSRVEARHSEDLERAERYDPLTGIPNMGYFFELATNAYDEMIAKGEEPAMLYMDLIDMSAFNMRYGYAVGDELLKEFSKYLIRNFGDNHCSRFGQDHFAVYTYARDLDNRLDTFIESFRRTTGNANPPVHIGVYLSPKGKRIGVSAACDRAKVACESISMLLESQYCYFKAEMFDQVERRQYIIDNFEHALEAGWIKIAFQPIVRSSTGRVCDEESLARWVDPERGTISPGEFIPVLEGVKLAYKLDLHILELALAKMQRMADAGLHVVSTSINLSRSDFETCDIVEEVRSRVDASGLGRDKVNIEITETAIGDDFDFMHEQIERFHELGFQVWMDDFGSEYSSLDFLQSMDFDLLKLDMRFMKRFDSGNDKSKVILTELVKMALGLGIDTVAEGVETQEQAEFLRQVGCSKMQGYLFCKPKFEDEILERYATGTAIGFENPAEFSYYSALGKVNLYDLSTLARDDSGVREYFDALPSAVLECSATGFSILRCNDSYLRFMKDAFTDDRVGEEIPYAQIDPDNTNQFVQSLRMCSEEGGRYTIDEALGEGVVVHSFIRRIDVNPITKKSGLAIAILAINRTP